MTVSETYDIGRRAYLNGDMFYTKSWMEESLKQYQKQDDADGVNLFDIYDHLAYSNYKVYNGIIMIY